MGNEDVIVTSDNKNDDISIISNNTKNEDVSVSSDNKNDDISIISNNVDVTSKNDDISIISNDSKSVDVTSKSEDINIISKNYSHDVSYTSNEKGKKISVLSKYENEDDTAAEKTEVSDDGAEPIKSIIPQELTNEKLGEGVSSNVDESGFKSATENENDSVVSSEDSWDLVDDDKPHESIGALLFKKGLS